MTSWLNKTHVGDCRALLKRMANDGVKVQTCVTSPPYWNLRDYQVDGQIGLESSFEEWLAVMVECFRAVREVLAEDGTLWVNCGDTYSSGGRTNYSSGSANNKGHGVQDGQARPDTPAGLKPKDLLGMPWELAFALRRDGWYLRCDIIWSKTNCMPESVSDRPTRAHEYLFLLSKSERYYYDAEAIREPVGTNTHARMSRAFSGYAPTGQLEHGGIMGPRDNVRRPGVNPKAVGHRADRSPSGWDRSDGNHRDKKGRYPGNGVGFGHGYDKSSMQRGRVKQNESFSEAISQEIERGFRNKRTVWTLNTEGFKGEHFATFPQKLIEPCILAGAAVGQTVLDPFMGAGTTALVATHLGRQFIGCELNQRYVDLHDQRQTTMGLAF